MELTTEHDYKNHDLLMNPSHEEGHRLEPKRDHKQQQNQRPGEGKDTSFVIELKQEEDQVSIDVTQENDQKDRIDSNSRPLLPNDNSLLTLSNSPVGGNQEDEETRMKENRKLSIFEKYLSIWVVVCMGIGIGLGIGLPQVSETLGNANVAGINIPTAVLLWAMIYPMMLNIHWSAIFTTKAYIKPTLLTSVINYCIQPFTMYGFALLFVKVIFGSLLDTETKDQYVAGLVILGSAPCTAMVFVWSYLLHGDPNSTLIQVAVNDIIMLFAFAPTVSLLINTTSISIPFLTILASVGFFVVIPLILSIITQLILKFAKIDPLKFNRYFLHPLKKLSTISLLLVLILIFMFQKTTILQRPLHIIYLTLPILFQTFFIWSIAFFSMVWIFKTDFPIAAPASLIAASNFFELAVGVSVSLFGTDSGAVFACVMGVLSEVPIMLFLVWMCKKFRFLFDKTNSKN